MEYLFFKLSKSFTIAFIFEENIEKIIQIPFSREAYQLI